MKMGVLIMAGIDTVYMLGLVILISTAWGSFGSPGLWYFFVIAADIGLLYGTHFDKGGLMTFWQIIMMINIVLQFFCWLLLPIMYFVVVLGSELSRYACEIDPDGEACGGMARILITASGILILVCIHIIAMPIYYIYFWIVVNSHRKILCGLVTNPQQQVIININNGQPMTQQLTAPVVPMIPVPSTVSASGTPGPPQY